MPPGSGWPDDLYIEGHVHAGGIHEYTPAGLGPQMTAPRWRLNAQLYDPADGDRLVFRLGDYAMGMEAGAEYRVQLIGVDPGVALKRFSGRPMGTEERLRPLASLQLQDGAYRFRRRVG